MFLFKGQTYIYIIFGIMTLQFIACNSKLDFQTKKNDPNPTSFIFQMPKSQLRDSVVSFFTVEKQMYNPYLQKIFKYVLHEKDDKDMEMQVVFNVETFESKLFGKDHFSNSSSRDDVYLQSFGRKWYSKVYFVNEHPMEFGSAYIITFKEINENKTELSVKAENPTVLYRKNGYSQSKPIIPDTKVMATTIEEYCLIQYIAQQLGDTTLPLLKTP